MNIKKYRFIEELTKMGELGDVKHEVLRIDSHDEGLLNEPSPINLPVLALRGLLVFPGSVTPVTIGRDKSKQIIRENEKSGNYIATVLQTNNDVDYPESEDLYKIGTSAKIIKVIEMPDDSLTVILQGVNKIEILEYTQTEPYFRANVQALRDDEPSKKESEKFDALLAASKESAIDVVTLSPNIPNEAVLAIKNIDTSRGVINFICANMEFSDYARQQLLETPSLYSRAKLLLEFLTKEQQLLRLKEEIQQKVKSEIDNQQKEYYLQQQLRTIQEELGTDSSEKEIEDLLERSFSMNWSEEVEKLFRKELAKVERMNPAVAEYSVQINYLNLLLDLPWAKCTKDNSDLKRAQKYLDDDHYGLKEVKERIIQHLAVLKLKGDLKSPIICLYGPPGVGKTSLGKSVARALKRKFGRIALGGVHDESEIRGHRRTYIGAMPGRIIQTIKKCGASNPVIILDEIDKVGVGTHGDPASALLEVLDPEQNGTFYDNYLDTEYDLSKVLFIATANNISKIHPALRDRMEMIDIAGYLPQEKVQIAKRHLLSKEIEAHGLTARQMKLSEETIDAIISQYTREAGVRKLDKMIAKLARYRATEIGMEKKFKAEIKPESLKEILGAPRYSYDQYEGNEFLGVVTGLAWTEVGGDILFIESSKNVGKGGLIITGNLGDVMKESASIALGWVKAHCEEYGIDSELFEKTDLRIHVPEGAIPKDGPSAGITMVTSLVSLITGRKVRDRVAMTGETTLRGKVLPVGGLKEKLLAAKRAGILDVVVSNQNQKDIEEIDQNYLEGLNIHYVTTLTELLEFVLLPIGNF